MTLEEYKKLIEWARGQNIQQLTVGDMTVVFTPKIPTLADYGLPENSELTEEQIELYSAGG